MARGGEHRRAQQTWSNMDSTAGGRIAAGCRAETKTGPRSSYDGYKLGTREFHSAASSVHGGNGAGSEPDLRGGGESGVRGGLAL